MDCRTVHDHLSGYFDHDVPQRTRLVLDQHLESCPRCCHELAQLQRLTAWVRDFPLIEPSPMFLQQVRAQVECLPRGSKLPFFRRLVGALPLQVAAAMVVIVSGVLVWQMWPHLLPGQVQEGQPPAYSEPWLFHERSVAPVLDAPPIEPAFEETLPMPAPLVQASPRWAGLMVQEEVVRIGREVPAVPRLSGMPTGGWSGEVAFFPSLTLRAADPAYAAQQIWELVPRIGGELLQSQGMVTPADRTSRGIVRLIVSITADRYPMFLEGIRQLAGTTISEERMAIIGRELSQTPPGALWRVDHSRVAKTPQLTLVMTILRR
jgi:anti-sigma factor RsiW